MATVTFEFEKEEQAKAFFDLFTSSDVNSKTSKAIDVLLHHVDAWDMSTFKDKEKGFTIKLSQD